MQISSFSRSRSRTQTLKSLCCAALIFIAPAGCKRNSINDGVPMTITLESTAFHQGEDIPRQFTCSGANTSPSLSWGALPPNTKSLTLLVIDLDSPLRPYTHWILYNLPPQPNTLPEAIPRTESLPNGAKQGTNSDPQIGYSGPCPPGDSPHRYVFTLYALDTTLTLPTTPDTAPDKAQLTKAMQGHILAAGQLTGHFHR
jgi:Raf kinase inhibitor-like YbhB/YbcL family protein